MADSGSTWARAYYRNHTHRRLTVTVSLHGPDRRSARAHCTVRGDGGDLGVCETPRSRRTAKGREEAGGASEIGALTAGGRSAVAEVTSSVGERLLRADSTSFGTSHRN
jgi:hypothetical protein